MAQAKYEYNFAGTTSVCGDDKTVAGEHHPEKEMSFCSILNSTLSAATYNGRVGDLQKLTEDKMLELMNLKFGIQ